MAIYATPELGPEEEAAVRAINAVRKQLRYTTAEPRRWLGSVRRVLAARAIQGSNSIEGYNVSVEDAVAAIDGDELADARTVDAQAVSGYRRAMTYVIGLSKDEHFEYNASLIRSLHFMMTEYSLEASPGLWRSRSIFVRNEASGDIVYEGPDPEKVPELIDELMQSLENAPPGCPAVVTGAMAHLNLVMIHPFRDGNGRMSRCLQTLVNARERVLAQELISIEEYLGRNTSAYYDILAEVGSGEWNPDNDARPWLRFCLEAHYIQAVSVLRRLQESALMWTALDSLREQAQLPERVMAALIDATIGLRIRNASYRAQLRRWEEGVSNQVATKDLRNMVDASLLRAHGRNRGAYYDASEALLEIRAKHRGARRKIDTSSLFDPHRSDEA